MTAYVYPVGVGDLLPDVPLFLVPRGHIRPLQRHQDVAAWEEVPARWRKVIDAKAG